MARWALYRPDCVAPVAARQCPVVPAQAGAAAAQPDGAALPMPVSVLHAWLQCGQLPMRGLSGLSAPGGFHASSECSPAHAAAQCHMKEHAPSTCPRTAYYNFLTCPSVPPPADAGPRPGGGAGGRAQGLADVCAQQEEGLRGGALPRSLAGGFFLLVGKGRGGVQEPRGRGVGWMNVQGRLQGVKP